MFLTIPATLNNHQLDRLAASSLLSPVNGLYLKSRSQLVTLSLSKALPHVTHGREIFRCSQDDGFEMRPREWGCKKLFNWEALKQRPGDILR